MAAMSSTQPEIVDGDQEAQQPEREGPEPVAEVEAEPCAPHARCGGAAEPHPGAFHLRLEGALDRDQVRGSDGVDERVEHMQAPGDHGWDRARDEPCLCCAHA